MNGFWRIVTARGEGATTEGIRDPLRRGEPAVIGSDRWEVLERIGDHVAGELSGEEARQTERFVLENPEARRLAGSYARMFALLSAIGREPLEPPEEIVDHAVLQAADEVRGGAQREGRQQDAPKAG